MKSKQWLILVCIAPVTYFACKKNTSTQASVASSLNASKISSISRGEPVTFTYKNSTTDTVKWLVTPSDSVVVKNYGDSASMIFNTAGQYTVRAIAGSSSSSINVSVDTVLYNDSSALKNDTVNHSMDTTALIPLTGDQINLTVTKYDSGSLSVLTFTATTLNTYNCLNNYLAIDYNVAGATDNINFDGVYVPGSSSTCTPGETQSTGSVSFYPTADGTYNLNIQLNGKTYSGTYSKTGKSIVFNWSYTSGVTISPLTLN